MINKRSLTIVELLIVIALIGAMASIVVPLIGNSLNERAFESAADVTGEQLVLARAHAQSTGEPVEVRYHVSSAQVEARMFTPWASGFENWRAFSPAAPVASSGSNSRGGDAIAQMKSDPQSRDLTIAEPWASRSLSDGVRIVNHRPANKSAVASKNNDEVGGVLAQLGLPGDSEPDIRLAVFMPDGSALLGAPVWFNDDDGRIGKLTINPWTGLPIFERVAASEDDDDSVSTDAPRSNERSAETGGRESKPYAGEAAVNRRAPGDSKKNPR